MSDIHNQKAVDILRTIRYATVATSTSNGRPWNSPVAHVLDTHVNIFWFSDKLSQHSQNVRENDNIFIAIYDSTVPHGDGQGLYIQAKAIELTDHEQIRFARRIKKGPDNAESPEEFLGESIRRVYKAVPQRMWINAAEVTNGEFMRDYRVEVPLEAVQALLSRPFIDTNTL